MTIAGRSNRKRELLVTAVVGTSYVLIKLLMDEEIFFYRTAALFWRTSTTILKQEAHRVVSRVVLSALGCVVLARIRMCVYARLATSAVGTKCC